MLHGIEAAGPAISLFAIAAAAPVGSFLGVAVLRSGTESILWPARSHCPHCAVVLAPRDLVPLASWLAARGRCRSCGEPLGLFYPAIEIAALAVALWSVLASDGAWQAAAGCLLGWTLLTIAAIDQRRMIIPDILSLPLIPAGLAVAALTAPVPAGAIADSAVGAALGYAILAALAAVYRRLRGREGLGRGDMKLMAAAGAWVGWQGLPSVMLVAGSLGLILAACGVLAGRDLDARRRRPFGPALCLAFQAVWLHGTVA